MSSSDCSRPISRWRRAAATCAWALSSPSWWRKGRTGSRWRSPLLRLQRHLHLKLLRPPRPPPHPRHLLHLLHPNQPHLDREFMTEPQTEWVRCEFEWAATLIHGVVTVLEQTYKVGKHASLFLNNKLQCQTYTETWGVTQKSSLFLFSLKFCWFDFFFMLTGLPLA